MSIKQEQSLIDRPSLEALSNDLSRAFLLRRTHKAGREIYIFEVRSAQRCSLRLVVSANGVSVRRGVEPEKSWIWTHMIRVRKRMNSLLYGIR